MKLNAPTKMTGSIVLLGDTGLPAFLIDAPRPFLFDAGMSFMGPVYVKALEEALGSRQPSVLCVTHSHYDHIGACSSIKGRYKGLKIAGHPLVREVMKKPGAVASMTHLSDIVRQMLGTMDPSTEFRPPQIDLILREGYTLEPGDGIVVTVMETPGHTRDSVTYLIDPPGAVVPGEALGVVQLDGDICPEFLTDFDSYVDSVKKILARRPSMILMPHGPSLTGDDAAEFLEGAIPAAQAWRDMISEALMECGRDVDGTTGRLFERLYDPSRIGQEKNAFRVNLRAKVSCIARIERQ